MECTNNSRSRAFTLIELLIAVGIIAILIGLTLTALNQAKLAAKRTTCGSNLRQIGLATASYLNDFNQIYYWRGDDIPLDGMDWYIYGGRETGNAVVVSQNDIFNNMIPRPLNSYVNNAIQLFRCPHDIEPQVWADGLTHYDFVGNSYTFNCAGHPLVNNVDPNMGLDQRSHTELKEPGKTVVYLDTSLHKAPGSWHGQNGNFCMADGHVIFATLPDPADENFRWGP